MLMTNKFKGLALMDKVPKELWMEVHDIVQEAVIKTIPRPGRSPGQGNGNPLQYFCLENSMDGGAW